MNREQLHKTIVKEFDAALKTYLDDALEEPKVTTFTKTDTTQIAVHAGLAFVDAAGARIGWKRKV